jgi:hypothetical protein
MNVFRQFNETQFKSSPLSITWFDKEGFIELDSNRRVSIRLDDNGTRDHFNGYWVEIINKHNGTIFKKFFRFKDHMSFTHRDTNKYYYAWYHDNKLDWYISRPDTKGTKEFNNVILNFINLFI